jgi:hypothetical protein
MSSEEDDEKRVYVQKQPNVGTQGTASEVVIREQPGAPPATTQVTEVVEPSPIVKSESISKHRTTNTSALIGIIVGVAVLLFGMYVVFRETPFLPYPLSVFVIVVVGIGLIAVGASLVSNRTTT